MEYIGAVTHLLTIDPNFPGHPSTQFYSGLNFHRDQFFAGFLNPYMVCDFRIKEVSLKMLQKNWTGGWEF